MAIKVNGTTVIDDSRNLVNIASGAGSSTTFNDVGTYCLGFYTGLGIHNGGATFSGGSIRTANTYAGGGGKVQFVPLILMLEVAAQVGLVLPLCQELGGLWEI